MPVQVRLLCKHLVPLNILQNYVVVMAKLSSHITFSNSLPPIYHDTCIKLARFSLFTHDFMQKIFQDILRPS